jgi:hypothetical protein
MWGEDLVGNRSRRELQCGGEGLECATDTYCSHGIFIAAASQCDAFSPERSHLR